MSADVWDVAIIGSGFGGSVCALRAVEAGLRTLVLERGPRLTPDAWDEIARGDRPLLDRDWRPGLIRLHGVRGLTGLSGNAVGGTSQLYTAVTVPPPDEIFDARWPGGWDGRRLQPYVERVAGIIRPIPIPRCVGRVRVLQSAGRLMGGEATRLPLAMEWPADSAALDSAPDAASPSVRAEVVTWLRGGPAARKRPLDQTYLARAEAAGAVVRDLHEATAIAPHDGGYRIRVRRWNGDGWAADEIAARRVVVAAGTLNTVRLLLQCRDVIRTLPRLSTALGRRFFTNGDFGALLVTRNRELTLDSAPPVTSWIDLWRSDRLYLMETGFVPALQGLIGRWSTRMASPAAGPGEPRTKAWSIGVMGFDSVPGVLRLDRRGRLVHVRDSRREPAFQRRAIERLRELAASVGARLLIPPPGLRDRPVTVHPLGGSALADSPDDGVVDSSGEAFGYPGLFVADGSLLPTPIGRAPSMTIAALAEHVSAGLLTRR